MTAAERTLRERMQDITRQYDDAVSRKKEIEAELPSLKFYMGGGDRRKKLLSEKVEVERLITLLKRERARLSDTLRDMKREADQTESDDLARLRIDNSRLRATVLSLEEKLRSTEQAYDTVVRQLNAIPHTIR